MKTQLAVFFLSKLEKSKPLSCASKTFFFHNHFIHTSNNITAVKSDDPKEVNMTYRNCFELL